MLNFVALYQTRTSDRAAASAALRHSPFSLVLGLALRAVLLPIVATALNLLVAAAAFGILEMLYGGSNPPLGGDRQKNGGPDPGRLEDRDL